MPSHATDSPSESGAEFGTQVALRAFARPALGARRGFDDRRLLAYRHPHERIGLAVAVVVIVAIVAAAWAWSWAAGLAIVAVLFLTAAITRLAAAQNLARAAEVTPTQFAHVYPMVAELRQRFRMPRTRVFVIQSPVIDAVSLGFQEPYVIVLNSALVDALDAQELKSVLGHEMGHIKFGHTRLGVLLGGVDARNLALPFPINLVASLRDLIFLWWQRSTEMSADRAGIVACRRPSKAISAQVKLSVGPTLHQHVNLEDLAHQADDLHSGVRRVEGFLSQLGASHPFLINRIQAMLDFVAESGPGTLETSATAAVETAATEFATETAAVEPAVEAAGEPLAEPVAKPVAERRVKSVAEPLVKSAAPVARLVERRGGRVTWEHALDGRRLVAGRSPSADVRLRDRAVSRRHFEIGWADGVYVIDDLGSSNGTFVDGQRITSAPLRDGSIIRVGFTELEFRAGLPA